MIFYLQKNESFQKIKIKINQRHKLLHLNCVPIQLIIKKRSVIIAMTA